MGRIRVAAASGNFQLRRRKDRGGAAGSSAFRNPISDPLALDDVQRAQGDGARTGKCQQTGAVRTGQFLECAENGGQKETAQAARRSQDAGGDADALFKTLWEE